MSRPPINTIIKNCNYAGITFYSVVIGKKKKYNEKNSKDSSKTLPLLISRRAKPI